MRGKSKKIKSRYISPDKLKAIFARQREKEKNAKLTRQLAKAVNKLRPRKSERGSIVFVNRDGTRGKGRKVGYAVYIDRNGKKTPVRQYQRDTGTVEKVPKPRKLNSIDITRVRSKKAKRNFLEAHVNPVAAGSLKRIKSSGRSTKKNPGEISAGGTRFHGAGKFRRIDINSPLASTIGKELVKAFRSVKSNRDFLVTFGIHVKKGNERYWFKTSRRIVRRDRQSITLAECRQFAGREIYAFIAHELLFEGLVLAGSAQFVSRLKENKGKKRKDWTKDGFAWGGAGAEDVTIENVEWRFDQNTFTKQ